MKTWRRRAGCNFHPRALDRVGIPTVSSGEDAMQWTALPAQERLLAGEAQQLLLNPRPAIRETTKLCFLAFRVPLQRRGGRRNRLRPTVKSAPAQRRSSHGDGGRQGLDRERAETPQDRGGRFCCGVSVSASASAPVSTSVSFPWGSFQKLKSSRGSGFSFPFLSFPFFLFVLLFPIQTFN